MLHQIMAVSCYHVQLLLHLTWFNCTQDWITFHQEPVLSQVALTTLRRLSIVKISVHVSKKQSEVSTVPNHRDMEPKLITSKDQLLTYYSDVFDGIGCFPDPPYNIHIDPSVTPKQRPCRPIPMHLKGSFRKKIDKMLQAGVLKPVDQATPWINSFVLVEGRISLEISSWKSTLTQPIWIKQLCMSLITSRCQKI